MYSVTICSVRKLLWGDGMHTQEPKKKLQGGSEYSLKSVEEGISPTVPNKGGPQVFQVLMYYVSSDPVSNSP